MDTRNRLDEFLGDLLLSEGPDAVVNCLDFFFGSFVITVDGVVVGANPEFINLVEYSPSELIGMSAKDLITEKEWPAMTRRFQENDTRRYELELLSKSGKIKIVLVTPRLFYAGNKKYRLAEFIDITEEKKIQAALSESEEKFHSVFEQAAVGIARVDLDGSFLELNQKYCDILGYTKNELMKKTFQEITHPDDLDRDLNLMHELLDGGRQTYSMEKRYIQKNGSVIWINLTGSMVKDFAGNTKYFISVIHDINYRKKIEKDLVLQATHDSLTGLDNRNSLSKKLDIELTRAVRYQRPLSLMMIDIDHFKAVNDNYGHQIGDQVLKELAELLRAFTRASDMAGRYGGEEFLLVTPELDHNKAMELAERIRQRVESNIIRTPKAILNITISIGISTYPKHGDDLDSLIKACDDAMYSAKEQGRNRVASAG